MGCVYFFKHKGLKPIKIGYSFSDSPKKRFSDFKTYAPNGAIMVGFILSNEAELLEAHLHEKYRKHRLKGEWFNINVSDAVREIKQISNQSTITYKIEGAPIEPSDSLDSCLNYIRIRATDVRITKTLYDKIIVQCLTRIHVREDFFNAKYTIIKERI